MRAGSRLRTGLVAAILLAVVVALVVVQPTVVGPDDEQGPQTVDDVKLVGFEGHEVQLWPYTSRRRDVGTATLPINVVVKDDAATTRRILAADASRNWTVTDTQGEAVVITGSGVNWTETRGATRYTYVQHGHEGRWMDETTQVHDGEYLGSRVHVRFYEFSAGDERWTALQAHEEHWDWFRLRHTVSSTARGQYTVEHQFYGTGLISDISRERFGNGGALDADGWVTVVDLVEWRPPPIGEPTGGAATATLALAFLFVGVRVDEIRESVRAAASQTDATTDHALLVLTLAVVPVAVRVAAIELERTYPALSPKVIAAPFYLVLAIGLPVAAGILGRRLAADEAFVAAVGGLGVGLLADYAYLGIQTLRFGVVVHRLVLLLGIGLVAAGGVRWAETPIHRHGYRVVGTLVWIGALVWPLAGL